MVLRSFVLNSAIFCVTGSLSPHLPICSYATLSPHHPISHGVAPVFKGALLLILVFYGQGQFFYGCQHLISAFVTCQGLTPDHTDHIEYP